MGNSPSDEVPQGFKRSLKNESPSWMHYFDITEIYKLWVGDETGAFLKPHHEMKNIPGTDFQVRTLIHPKDEESYLVWADTVKITTSVSYLLASKCNSSEPQRISESQLNSTLTQHNNKVYDSLPNGIAAATDLTYYPQPTDSTEVLKQKAELNRSGSWSEIWHDIIFPNRISDASEYQSNEQVAHEYIRQRELDNQTSDHDTLGHDRDNDSNRN